MCILLKLDYAKFGVMGTKPLGDGRLESTPSPPPPWLRKG